MTDASLRRAAQSIEDRARRHEEAGRHVEASACWSCAGDVWHVIGHEQRRIREIEAGQRPTDAEIEARVSAWHAGGVPGELHEALGWTWAEYTDWVADPRKVPGRALPKLAEGCREGRDG